MVNTSARDRARNELLRTTGCDYLHGMRGLRALMHGALMVGRRFPGRSGVVEDMWKEGIFRSLRRAYIQSTKRFARRVGPAIATSIPNSIRI
jgi:hypothetical protein